MLAPDVIAFSDSLAEAFSTIKRVDAFAFSAMNTLIGKLSPDPDWLGSIRQELALLSGAGATWQQDKPAVLAPLLTQFPDYSALFSGVADTVPQVKNDKSALVDLLDQLRVALGNAHVASGTAERLFTLRIQNLQNVQQVFSSSLQKAWDSLADEEQEMIALASQVTALQDKLNGLQEDISGAEVESGKSYVESAVSISYTLVAAAGAEVPYLEIAGLVFTVGKLAYDLIVTDKEISETIQNIVDLRIKASEEAQAAAMTKAVIQLIDNFEKSLLAVQNELPAFSDMWAAERDKVANVVSAINAGSDPRLLIDIASMPAAAASWKTLADFASRLPLTIQPGKSVVLSTTPSAKEATAP